MAKKCALEGGISYTTRDCSRTSLREEATGPGVAAANCLLLGATMILQGLLASVKQLRSIFMYSLTKTEKVREVRGKDCLLGHLLRLG